MTDQLTLRMPAGARRLVAVALLSLGPSSAMSMNLSGFIAGSIENSTEVREQVHVYRQVIQDYESALSGWRPTLDLAASYGQVSRKATNTLQRRRNFDRAESSLTLSQNLFDGFDTTNQIKQARARITSAAYLLLDTADNVALEAAGAYMDALTERRLVQFAAENVESHERILAKIRELSDQGLTRRSDVEQTQGRLARAQASLIAQQNNLEDALTTLHKLLGRYIQSDELEEPQLLSALDGDIQPLLDQALEVHPAIESAKRNIEAARFEFERSKSPDLPRLDLQLRQEIGNDVEGPTGNTNERSLQLNLNYNLYRGGADRANQRKSASVIQANKAFLDRVRRQVIDALRLSWSADRALQRQLPFLGEHVDKSLETLDLYREEYLLQRRDLIDVLDAEGELNNALSARARARYSAHLARLRVREGVGDLLGALNLEADLSDDTFRLVGIEPRGIDGPEIESDRDNDGVPDNVDQCDNSVGPVDAYGCSSIARVSLGYQGIAFQFEPQADRIAVLAGVPNTIAVATLLENDRSDDIGELRFRSFTQPAHGTLRAEDSDTLVYTPAAGFTGTDSFTYEVTNRRALAATATVTLDVRAPSAARGYPEVMTVRFDYKKLTLTGESMRALAPVLDRLRAQPEVQVEVSTYTDNVGSARYNEKLSQRRADAMKRLLQSEGIAPERISAIGMGENRPVASNETDEGRALNRRGEFRFFQAQ